MRTRTTPKAIQKCAEWLAYCLSIGWKKRDLDRLERLWWEHHDRYGQLILNRGHADAN
jgi:hypothetical protein